MKTLPRPHPYYAAFLLLLAFAWQAFPIQVTYQVDMSVQIGLGGFNPSADEVFISGNFSNPDWQYSLADGSTNYILTANAGNSDIYEGTFSIDNTVGAFENHQFVINPNGDFSDLRWETSVGNRFFQVPGTDTNLPVVFWNGVTNASSLVVTPVTFQVDMSVQTELGNFDPNTDYVLVAGDWNWNEGTAPELSNDGSNIWSATINVTNLAGGTVHYKFIMATFASGNVWEANGVGPGGADNREFALEASAQTLPVVYFNNLESVSSGTPVTFQVNMAAQMALGNFVDGVNTVVASGDFNNWVTTFTLTNDPAEPTIYQGTTDVIGASNSLVSFQYVIDAVTWETAVGNRTFNLADTNQVLDPVYWNNVGDLGTVATAPAGGDQVEVSWTAAPLVRLQMSTGLPGGWTDVPGTVGQSNATVTVTTDETYLRLIGP